MAFSVKVKLFILGECTDPPFLLTKLTIEIIIFKKTASTIVIITICTHATSPILSHHFMKYNTIHSFNNIFRFGYFGWHHHSTLTALIIDADFFQIKLQKSVKTKTVKKKKIDTGNWCLIMLPCCSVLGFSSTGYMNFRYFVFNDKTHSSRSS